ncbi:hypothetical protein GCM10027280_57040 [Micromonospora polyrhachis]|uniref:Uncharacterized protein n=1 Tax=Micromonospora polyrhachis TaxID=1282883 RepID=A0A7W7WR72_9ACTN|nr:hypothetical protein [Micromonospora polyrhachis]MBB4960227.1 hypothetical protein [Micromonospora polyrhachis]
MSGTGPMTPLPARSRNEAQLHLELLACPTCGEAGLELDQHALLLIDGQPIDCYAGQCAGCGVGREFRYAIAPDGEAQPEAFGGDTPSRLVDAGEWLWVADRIVAGLTVWLGEDVEEDPTETAEEFALASAAMDEVLKFVPAGAATPPPTAFWTERGREMWEEAPERFDAPRLAAVRDDYRMWAERLDANGTLSSTPIPAAEAVPVAAPFAAQSPEQRPSPVVPTSTPAEAGRTDGLPAAESSDHLSARSTEEAMMFLRLNPCGCGSNEFPPSSATSRLPDAHLTRYEGNCVDCGRSRSYTFRLPANPASGPGTRFGPAGRPSTIIDPGEWLAVARGSEAEAAQSAMDHPAEREHVQDLLRLAAEAISEVLNFLPPGASAVPPEASWTPEGRAVRNLVADEAFDVVWLSAERTRLLDAAHAGLVGDRFAQPDSTPASDRTGVANGDRTENGVADGDRTENGDRRA